MNYFITGIDTDSGKTLASAIVCEALRADYWKPVQAGTPKDSDTVRSLISNTKTIIHPERYQLKTPASPHAAARLENIAIQLDDFTLPVTDNNLVIEGAGGCLVPLNDQDFVIDLAKKFKASIILVADLYLGSINHTLLSCELLKQRNLPVKGIIFNGEPNAESERIILHHSNYDCLLRIAHEKLVDPLLVTKYAQQLNLH